MVAGRADSRDKTRDRWLMSSLAQILEGQSVLVVESTLPGDMTIAEWRRGRTRRDARPRRGRRWLSVLASEVLAAPDRDLGHRGAH
jgi:hypothetical protein